MNEKVKCKPPIDFFKKLPKKRLIAIVLVVAVIAGLCATFLNRSTTSAPGSVDYVTQSVTLDNINQSLTASAPLAAANSYTVTAVVEEDILSAYFEEGDIVEKGTVLYELDSSDAQSSIESNEISLTASQRNYNNALESYADLAVTTPISGSVVEFLVEVGDDVNQNQTIATVQDSRTMTIDLLFPAYGSAEFWVGQSATLVLDGSFESLDATVSALSQTTQSGGAGSIVRTVTLSVSNPGGLAAGQMATATIDGIGSSASGYLEYNAQSTLTADVSGTVEALVAQEGDWLTKGQVVVQLSSDSISDSITSQAESLRKTELQMESAQRTLENYTITSPISGTVVEKNYKVGETTEQGKALCVIYDLDYLTLTMSIDELDIANVAVGQTVNITSEAVAGLYLGVITKVSVVGTTSSGVTTYPVTVEITDYDGLLPGMNVDASIVLAQANDVLTIPISALNRNNTVLVTADSPSAINAVENENTPEGYAYVAVETGLSDDSSIEVRSGLQEGDTVAYAGLTLTTEGADMMMPGMGTGIRPSSGMSSGMGTGSMSGGRP